jgi:hypothetical protein
VQRFYQDLRKNFLRFIRQATALAHLNHRFQPDQSFVHIYRSFGQLFGSAVQPLYFVGQFKNFEKNILPAGHQRSAGLSTCNDLDTVR